MTDQRSFSQQEWRVVRSAPLVAGLAVARAAPSGVLGGLSELRRLIGDIGRAVPGLTDTPLVRSILDGHPRWHLERLTGSDVADPARMLADAVETCAEARALIDDRATPEELREYRAWVVTIANDVAGASTEDGRAESDEELAAIAAIEAALRAP